MSSTPAPASARHTFDPTTTPLSVAEWSIKSFEPWVEGTEYGVLLRTEQGFDVQITESLAEALVAAFGQLERPERCEWSAEGRIGCHDLAQPGSASCERHGGRGSRWDG